jgi:hypothetical protein
MRSLVLADNGQSQTDDGRQFPSIAMRGPGIWPQVLAKLNVAWGVTVWVYVCPS